jgi:hypothetical protein
MKTLELTAPSIWASAIVNLDYSHLSAEDVSALNTFLAREGVSFSDCLLVSYGAMTRLTRYPSAQIAKGIVSRLPAITTVDENFLPLR